MESTLGEINWLWRKGQPNAADVMGRHFDLAGQVESLSRCNTPSFFCLSSLPKRPPATPPVPTPLADDLIVLVTMERRIPVVNLNDKGPPTSPPPRLGRVFPGSDLSGLESSITLLPDYLMPCPAINVAASQLVLHLDEQEFEVLVSPR